MSFLHRLSQRGRKISHEDITIMPIARFKYIPGIKEIERETLQFPWSDDFYAERMVTYPHLFYGAFYVGIMVGYVCGCVKPEIKRLPTGERATDYFGLVSKIAVLPKFRGLGIGTELMTTMINAFEQYVDVHRLVVQVRKDNIDAINLYTSPYLEFKPYRPFKYSNGADGIELYRELYPIDP
jgi:ribosomal protein S18 acetylase RimI-like enzyme